MKKELLLSKLVSFKTISLEENLNLINFIYEYLKKFNIKATILKGEKNRANLYAMIGPNKDDGIFLSGHTDVVPVEGQNWITNPFKTEIKNNKIFGRGTADMKGFLSVVLSLIPNINQKKLIRPIHLMFSYDEEVGCVGIQKAIPFIKKMKNKPNCCIVGEPTEMKVISQHKGKKNFQVFFHGIESHSSLVDKGVNAIEYASIFVNFLTNLQNELKKKKNKNFSPSYSTISVGKISGGIALNIVPKFCSVEFEIRDLPNIDYDSLIKQIKEFLKLKIEKSMKKVNKNSKVEFKINNNFPGLYTNEKKSIVNLSLLASNSNNTGAVSFGTEAGVFNNLGIDTIVCGPGSIEQAHKANEYIRINQLDRCEIFLEKIISTLY